MAGTKIVEVRKALMSAIAELPEFTEARVDMTWSAKAQVREQVFTTEARFTHDSASMRAGRNFRNEDGRFNLVILVLGVDQEATWSAERAGELGVAAEEWIADNKRGEALDIEGLNWIVVEGDGSLVEAYLDRGTAAELTYSIVYQARLT